MGAFEEIADRRIRAGYEAGLFDGLEGAGKPIRDLDRIRPPGWWAARLAGRERSQTPKWRMRALEFDQYGFSQNWQLPQSNHAGDAFRCNLREAATISRQAFRAGDLQR